MVNQYVSIVIKSGSGALSKYQHLLRKYSTLKLLFFLPLGMKRFSEPHPSAIRRKRSTDY